MKDIKTILLVLLSTGLVGTWVYHLYDKTQYSSRIKEVFIKDSTAVAQGIQDSLQKIYTATINTLDTRLDSTRTTADSLKTQLGTKLNEIYTLKNEIDGILKKRGASAADLTLAKEKIAELQQMVDELEGQKDSMEEEKQRLSDVMLQLSGEIVGLQQNMKKLDEENKSLTEKVNLASVFVASEIKFSPVTVKNDKEQETNLAKKTSKMVISFAVQNNLNEYKNADVYVMIIQPNGKLLKNDDVWEASSMMTLHNGSKMNFTRKVRFEYLRGEAKRLIFSLNASEYEKGNYTLQIYHNGYMIGQVTKTLS